MIILLDKQNSIILWKKKQTCFYFYFFCRSAPASPSHVAGSFTPDQLSREGSPTPDAAVETEVSQSMTHAGAGAHLKGKQLQYSHISMADLHYSQSAPGSPSGLLFVCSPPLVNLSMVLYVRN